jgi:hypothetical protein
LVACSAVENNMEIHLEGNRVAALAKDQVVVWEVCLEAGRAVVVVEEEEEDPAAVEGSEACLEAYWEAVRYVFLATLNVRSLANKHSTTSQTATLVTAIRDLQAPTPAPRRHRRTTPVVSLPPTAAAPQVTRATRRPHPADSMDRATAAATGHRNSNQHSPDNIKDMALKLVSAVSQDMAVQAQATTKVRQEARLVAMDNKV